MEIGTGIFVSALLLAVVILYAVTKDRWAWRRIITRTALVLLAIVLPITLVGIGYYLWPEKIGRQTEYAGIRLGISPAEIKYIKGYPPIVYGPSESETEDWKPIIETKNIEKGKSVEDYTEWSYTYDHYRIDVTFNSTKTTVIEVTCFSGDQLRRCPTIAGIADGASEQEVIRRFGQADRSKISGVTKALTYSKIGVLFWLERERVYMIAINDPNYRGG